MLTIIATAAVGQAAEGFAWREVSVSLEPVTTPGVRRIEGVAHPELFGGRALCYTALHRLTQTRG